MAPVASVAAAFNGVGDKGEAVAMGIWHLTPAAVVVMVGREGSSVGVGIGVGVSGIGIGGDGAGGVGRCCW